MNRFAYRIYFVLFEAFFLLSCAPFVAGLILLPREAATSVMSQVVVACLGFGVVLGVLASTWLAAICAHRSVYELESPAEAVRYAFSEARIRLAFAPVVGRYFAPKAQNLNPNSPTRPT